MKIHCGSLWLVLLQVSCVLAENRRMRSPFGLDDNSVSSTGEGVAKVVTVQGGRGELPCDITAHSPGDSVYLVLWYRKDSAGTPIYSYDSRQAGGPLSGRGERPDLWSEPTAFGDRAHFRVTTTPAALSVTGVQRFDAGAYICRVDFRQSPTVYHQVVLDVIVPPQKPLIFDHSGRQVEGDLGIGPYREGDSITLECNVPGGNPLPKVLWYLDDQVIDDQFQQTYDGTIRNSLTIRKLTRKHTTGSLRCLATNNNITRPAETSIKLKMLFPPQGAQIIPPTQPLTAGRNYAIACKVWGSSPAARIEWFRGTAQSLRPILAFNESVSHDRNVTTSWVHLVPTPEHHHQTLTCRGTNDDLMAAAAAQIVEDYHTLEVYFAPTVTLSLGRMVNPKDLEEGDDVYFSCTIKANPPAYKLTWWHNGEEVKHDQSNGIIISNQSLVLQKVTRDQAGSYTCEASNVEGDQVSKPVVVTIMYKPICLDDQKIIYGVSEGETAHIRCLVDAYPEAEDFSWTFNTSSGGMDLPRDSYANQGTSSLLSYVPRSQMDYGTVLCRASNLVGRQVVPCVYHVIPAGPPDPPKNCSLTNQTQDSLQVDCKEGFSSGLKQEFHMEVYTHPKNQLLVNITARSPKLLARGLPPDSTLFLRIYASTIKGKSRSVTFEGYTLRTAVKQTVVDGSSQAELETSKEPWSLLTVVLLGTALTLLVIIFVVGFVTKVGRGPNRGPGARHGHSRDMRTGYVCSNNANNGKLRGVSEEGPTANGTDPNMLILNPGLSSEDDLRRRQQQQSQVLHHQAGTVVNKAFLDSGLDQQLRDKNPDVIPPNCGGEGLLSSPPTSSMDGDLGTGLRAPLPAKCWNTLATPGSSMSHQQHATLTPTPHGGGYANMVHLTSQGVTGPSGHQQTLVPTRHNLYSPAATSDSSGFSESRESSSTGHAHLNAVPAHGYQFLNNSLHTQQHSTASSVNGQREPPLGRTGSPSFFSYHNPTLTASPYSTLPRRIGAVAAPRSLVGGRHSPLLEMTSSMPSSSAASTLPLGAGSGATDTTTTAGSMYFRSMNAGGPAGLTAVASPRVGSVGGGSAAAQQNKITARTPLLEDDRESCV